MDSSNLEHFSKFLTSVTSRRFIIKGLTAIAIGDALDLGRSGKVFAQDFGTGTWLPFVMGTPINGLAFRITTGGDDVRGPGSQGTSAVFASVVIKNNKGTASLMQPLNVLPNGQ